MWKERSPTAVGTDLDRRVTSGAGYPQYTCSTACCQGAEPEAKFRLRTSSSASITLSPQVTDLSTNFASRFFL